MTTNKTGSGQGRAPYRIKDDDDGGHVRFTIGSWEIHELFEDSEWVEIFHCCKKYNPIGGRVEYAYQIPGDVQCPGCGQRQPDEIQALEQMHNMDRPSRMYGRSTPISSIREAKEAYQKMYAQDQRHFIRGNGVNE